MRGIRDVVVRLAVGAALASLPATASALVLVIHGDVPAKIAWSVAAVVIVLWLALPVWLAATARRPLRTITNLLTALREGDFSLRARADGGGEEAVIAAEVNALADVLQQQRLGALEATALLRRVVAELDVAVFTFDGGRRLRLVNRAGERVLGAAAERALGAGADVLGVAALLDGAPARTLEARFPGAHGTWQLRRATFREGGRAHDVVVLTDVARALRDEERLAWQRLVRVLGHEINNSLTPIRSIATSLADALGRAGDSGPVDGELRADLRGGLDVVARRAEALHRFLSSYARLTGLPPPTRRALPVAAWVARVAALETRLAVVVEPGPPLTLHADGDQLEQLLINLVKNAAEAALETGGGVVVRWRATADGAVVEVLDEGMGIDAATDLFVPFFSTKPGGSGIGLALSRQIAEAHGGQLTLESRTDRRGCCARLVLPMA